MKITYDYGENQAIIDRLNRQIESHLRLFAKTYAKKWIEHPEQRRQIVEAYRNDKTINDLQLELNRLLLASVPAMVVQAESDEDEKILDEIMKNRPMRIKPECEQCGHEIRDVLNPDSFLCGSDKCIYSKCDKKT